jgi:hypothetical protein
VTHLLPPPLGEGQEMEGNTTPIVSAPNISRVGAPLTLVTILAPTLWIPVRYFWRKF